MFVVWAPQCYAQPNAGKITPFSLLEVDTVQAYRYAWRCGFKDTCRSFSVFAPEQNFERIQFISPQGEKITIPLVDYLGSEKVTRQRAYAALAPPFMQANQSLRSIQRMGYRKLAPFASLGDVQIGDDWFTNVLIFRPIVFELTFMNPQGAIRRYSLDKVQAWRRPILDTALFAQPRVVESKQRLRWPTVDVYVEVGGGVAANTGRLLTVGMSGGYLYGWTQDRNLASVYLASGVSLWNRFLVGLRQGFEIPFNRGPYTPNDNWSNPDKYSEMGRQIFTAHTMAQARYLNSDRNVFYTGTLLCGLAYSVKGADTWFELSNGLSIKLIRNTFLLLDAYFFVGENGEDYTVHFGPGIRAGLATIVPVWRGVRNRKG